MSKLVIMRTNESGWVRVGETPNGGGPAPVEVMGYVVGKTHTYTKTGKRVFNKQLHQAGFLATMVMHEDAWVSGWTRTDGSAFVAEHSKHTSSFTRVS